MDVRVGLRRKLIQPVHPKGDQSWLFIGRTDAEAETPVLWPPHEKCWLNWKRLWCWEELGAGGEGDGRVRDGWMAFLTRWAWIWVNSESWWWTGRPGMLRFMGSQTVRHEEWLNWTELNWLSWKMMPRTFEILWTSLTFIFHYYNHF